MTKVYLPDKGEILLGGQAHTRWDTDAVRRRVVVAAQEPVLFPGTVFENLVGDGETLSAEQVAACCRLVGIHDEIMALPGQYQFPLGENGKPLSRGQRQRLCVARALLRQGDVYIFDEPTSALDPAHARLVLDTIRALSKRAIVLLVSHDAGVEEMADRTLRLAPRPQEGQA